jgi:broad specificity phosphatase PhoE
VRTIAFAVLCGIALLWMEVATAHAEMTIVIVRHGEKPADGLGQLTCQGLNRSLALAPLLLARYGNPIAVYAPNPILKKRDGHASYAYVRPLATIEPLAVRAGLPVTLDWGMADIGPFAEQLLAQPSGTKVVAWEHHWAERLAKTLITRLGGNSEQVPRWADNDFDSVFVIRVIDGPDGKRRATFTHDSEGLDGLPDTCDNGPGPSHP